MCVAAVVVMAAMELYSTKCEVFLSSPSSFALVTYNSTSFAVSMKTTTVASQSSVGASLVFSGLRGDRLSGSSADE